MYCSHCGKQISPEAAFCRYCGNQVEDGVDDSSTGEVLQAADSNQQVREDSSRVSAVPEGDGPASSLSAESLWFMPPLLLAAAFILLLAVPWVIEESGFDFLMGYEWGAGSFVLVVLLTLAAIPLGFWRQRVPTLCAGFLALIQGVLLIYSASDIEAIGQGVSAGSGLWAGAILALIASMLSFLVSTEQPLPQHESESEFLKDANAVDEALRAAWSDEPIEGYVPMQAAVIPRCASCDTPLPSEADFCPDCGTRIGTSL